MEDKYQVNLKTKENPDGPRLCMAEDSGKGFMEQDGLYFKDLVGDGKLYPYEDWRLTAQERAEDLASRLNVEEMLGLMLHTPQQMLPGFSNPYLGDFTYGGREYRDTDGSVPVYAMTDQQKKFVEKDFIRHYLLSIVPDAHGSAMWTNQMQEAAETAIATYI